MNLDYFSLYDGEYLYNISHVSNGSDTVFVFSSTNGTFEKSWYLTSRLHQVKLFTYIFLCLQIIIGVTGNVISSIVWIKGKDSSDIACSTYFKLLAFADIFTLINCGLLYVMQNIVGLETVDHYLSLCVGYTFLRYFTPSLSTWLVVCISFERFLSLSFPFTFTTKGARTRAKFFFIVLILTLTAINSYAFGLQIDYVSDFEQYCILPSRLFYTIMYQVATIWTLCVIPFCLIVTCNVLILIQLCMMRRTIKNQRQDRVVMFTKICIASGLLQIVSIAPTMFAFLIEFQYFVHKGLPDTIAMSYISRNTLYLNNCFNCLVYCFSSKTFRSDLRELLCCKNVPNQQTC